MLVRTFEPRDRDAVTALWTDAGLTRAWNDPHRDIDRAVGQFPDLFLIAAAGDGTPIGTAVGGYDGHRGALYYLAVAGSHRGQGIARTLIAELERRLILLGCPKLNVMVRSTNTGVLGFYDVLGYTPDDVTIISRRLIPDD